MEVDLQVSCAMAMLVRDLMLMSKRRMRNCCKESLCPGRALSVRMFLNFLQGRQRHISKSGDLEAEQGVRFMGVLQEEQKSVCFSIPLRNSKSLACFSVSVMEWISLCREEVIMKLMRSVE